MGDETKKVPSNADIVAVLRRVADLMEDPESEVFVVMSAEVFTTSKEGKIESSNDLSIGGKVPEELDARLVLIGCIGNLIKTMGESVDLKGVSMPRAMELLGVKNLKSVIGGLDPDRKGKIISGGFSG